MKTGLPVSRLVFSTVLVCRIPWRKTAVSLTTPIHVPLATPEQSLLPSVAVRDSEVFLKRFSHGP